MNPKYTPRGYNFDDSHGHDLSEWRARRLGTKKASKPKNNQWHKLTCEQCGSVYYMTGRGTSTSKYCSPACKNTVYQISSVDRSWG